MACFRCQLEPPLDGRAREIRRRGLSDPPYPMQRTMGAYGPPIELPGFDPARVCLQCGVVYFPPNGSVPPGATG